MVTIFLEILLLLPSVSMRMMMMVCTLALMIKIINTFMVMMPVQMIHAQKRRKAQSTE
jgi:hypothetical protein